MNKAMACNPEKLVFLDIDHVLTNTDVDNTSFLSYDPSKYKLSDFNLKHLNRILDETGAKIIIASNWRKFVWPDIYWAFNGKKYKSPLEDFNFIYDDYIVGMLPPERHLTKCECLELWFEDNDWFSKDGKYVILEDDLSEGYQSHPIYSKHLILTDSSTGLTKENAKTAITILNGD